MIVSAIANLNGSVLLVDAPVVEGSVLNATSSYGTTMTSH